MAILASSIRPRPSGNRLVAAAVAVGLALSGTAASAAPKRVVSLNLCTDQLAVLLLPRSHLASLSYLVSDPHLSRVADRVAGIPTNRGGAEEAIAAGPDLVLADRGTARDTLDLLLRKNINVYLHDVPDDVAGIEREIRKLATALDASEAADVLLTEMRNRLAAVRSKEPKPTALWFFPNAYTSGRGTLSDAALTAAGFLNLAPRSGYAGISVEALVLARPDRLVLQHDDAPTFSNAAAVLAHPAVNALWPASRRIDLPGSLLICGTPFFAEAVERLAAAR